MTAKLVRTMLLGIGLAMPVAGFAGSASAEGDLAAAAANPIASVISLPFESTWDFGADDGTAYILNIQPVVPVAVGDWNLIS